MHLDHLHFLQIIIAMFLLNFFHCASVRHRIFHPRHYKKDFFFLSLNNFCSIFRLNALKCTAMSVFNLFNSKISFKSELFFTCNINLKNKKKTRANERSKMDEKLREIAKNSQIHLHTFFHSEYFCTTFYFIFCCVWMEFYDIINNFFRLSLEMKRFLRCLWVRSVLFLLIFALPFLFAGFQWGEKEIFQAKAIAKIYKLFKGKILCLFVIHEIAKLFFGHVLTFDLTCTR